MQNTRIPGFYIEGKFYGSKLGQALAKAQFRADEYSRAVDINHTHDGVQFERFRTVHPRQSLSAMRARINTIVQASPYDLSHGRAGANLLRRYGDL
jgi:GTP-sensing pleiotropic transcriptional regulator CodY